MLLKPCNGWTDFMLEGAEVFGLSYIDDIAFEWIEQAIHGLEVMQPFCVKGFLEPNRMLCTVSFWNCHVIIEDDDRHTLKQDDIEVMYSHTSMIDFCKNLYNDVSGNIDEWVSFLDYDDENLEQKKQRLIKMLERLKELINLREERFGENRCFL